MVSRNRRCWLDRQDRPNDVPEEAALVADILEVEVAVEEEGGASASRSRTGQACTWLPRHPVVVGLASPQPWPRPTAELLKQECRTI
jgi:hypothetical protein